MLDAADRLHGDFCGMIAIRGDRATVAASAADNHVDDDDVVGRAAGNVQFNIGIFAAGADEESR